VLLALHVEQHSGPQRSLLPRLAALREEGAVVTTLVPAPGPAAELAAQVGSVEVGIPGALMRPTSAADGLRALSSFRAQARATEAAARSRQADLVIVSSERMPGALLGARRAAAAALLYAGDPRPEGAARAARALRALGGRWSNGVVAPSRYAAQGHRGAAVVSPPIAADPKPGSLPERAAALRRALGIGAGDRLVASLGAITRGRGQDTLIAALAESGRKWRLVIGGEPYAREPDLAFAAELRRLAAGLDVAERVVFAGRVEDPFALYAAANLFVNPARAAEAFGRAACEALTTGCAVVSTDVGGVREALRAGETALLVPPDAPGSLAAAVERLLGDPELTARLAEAGAEDVGRRFAPAVTQPAFEAAVAAATAAAASPR